MEEKIIRLQKESSTESYNILRLPKAWADKLNNKNDHKVKVALSIDQTTGDPFLLIRNQNLNGFLNSINFSDDFTSGSFNISPKLRKYVPEYESDLRLQIGGEKPYLLEMVENVFNALKKSHRLEKLGEGADKKIIDLIYVRIDNFTTQNEEIRDIWEHIHPFKIDPKRNKLFLYWNGAYIEKKHEFLKKFCDYFNLNWKIMPLSSYYPTSSTIEIECEPINKEDNIFTRSIRELNRMKDFKHLEFNFDDYKNNIQKFLISLKSAHKKAQEIVVSLAKMNPYMFFKFEKFVPLFSKDKVSYHYLYHFGMDEHNKFKSRFDTQRHPSVQLIDEIYGKIELDSFGFNKTKGLEITEGKNPCIRINHYLDGWDLKFSEVLLVDRGMTGSRDYDEFAETFIDETPDDFSFLIDPEDTLSSIERKIKNLIDELSQNSQKDLDFFMVRPPPMFKDRLEENSYEYKRLEIHCPKCGKDITNELYLKVQIFNKLTYECDCGEISIVVFNLGKYRVLNKV